METGSSCHNSWINKNSRLPCASLGKSGGEVILVFWLKTWWINLKLVLGNLDPFLSNLETSTQSHGPVTGSGWFFAKGDPASSIILLLSSSVWSSRPAFGDGREKNRNNQSYRSTNQFYPDVFLELWKLLKNIALKDNVVKQVRNLCVYSRPGDRVWP